MRCLTRNIEGTEKGDTSETYGEASMSAKFEAVQKIRYWALLRQNTAPV